MRAVAPVALLVLALGASLLMAPKPGAANPATAPAGSEEPSAGSLYLPIIRNFTGKVYIPLINNVAMPSEPMPADQAVDVSANSYLAWSFAGPPAPGGYRYDVYFGANSATPVSRVATNLQDPWLETDTFAGATAYSWQVVAVNPADGAQFPGPVWRFTTEAFDAPPQLDAMITIPAGPFWMGCDRHNPFEDECSYNEYHQDEPVRRVMIDAFAIDKFEVTNQEYLGCMAANRCGTPRKTAMLDDPAYASAPVLYVSWWDAQAFCGWEGKRLPTEAEWEKAARGTIDTRKYPWGNTEPDCTQVNQTIVNEHSIYEGLSCPAGPVAGIQNVGIHPRGASPYGVHDMAGNAFEWVQDKYDVNYYLYAPLDNPQGPPFSRVTKTYGQPDQPPPRDEGRYAVYSIRGGSWRDDAEYVRVVHRHWGHHGDSPNTDIPFFRNNKVGFRCAQSSVQ